MVFNALVFTVLTFWLTHLEQYAQIDHDVIVAPVLRTPGHRDEPARAALSSSSGH